MASDVSLQPGDLGFISNDGKTLKSKEKLANEEVELNSSKAKTAQSQDSQDQSVENGLGKVRERFNNDANSVISGLNQDQAQLEKAEKVVKAQVAVAKELKQALKDGDREKVNELKEDFKKLEKQREELDSEVKNYNQERSGDRVQGIRLGNETKVTIRTKEIEIQKSREVDQNSVDSINRFIEDSKNTLNEIDTQKQTTRGSLNELKSVVSDVKQELSSLEENSLKSIGEATKIVDDIAAQIKGDGLKLFEQASLGKLDAATVTSQLLKELKA